MRKSVLSATKKPSVLALLATLLVSSAAKAATSAAPLCLIGVGGTQIHCFLLGRDGLTQQIPLGSPTAAPAKFTLTQWRSKCKTPAAAPEISQETIPGNSVANLPITLSAANQCVEAAISACQVKSGSKFVDLPCIDAIFVVGEKP